MKVLLFTKNILAEVEFQNRLQELDFEVYCSSQILSTILCDKDISNIYMFDIVILSENISNKEVEVLCPLMKRMKKIVLRKTESVIDEHESENLGEYGLDGWVSNTSSKDVLREEIRLYEKEIRQQEIQVTTNLEKTRLPLWFLTPSERDVLSILIAEKGKMVNRKTLATRMWGTYDSTVCMTRLSTIIKNLRMKLEIKGTDQDIIVTQWGRGYQLTDLFFDFYEVDSQFLLERAE